MELNIGSRLKNAWNAFQNKSPGFLYDNYNTSYGTYYRPDRPRFTRGNERSIVTSVYNRIAMDVASISIKHCKLDDTKRYKEDIEDGLNNCLTLEANIDQTSRAFIQDVVISMLDEGCVAIVPVDTNINPHNSSSYDIITMRTGKIIEWFPDRVKVEVYNDKTGLKEEIILAKKNIGIIENPFYSVMNEPNSTLQRLIRKLVLLDSVDEQSSSGKLDLIVQLPYIIKSEARKKQANDRRFEIENQLKGSKYGIAYIDGTEKVTQLNRSVENNLMKQIEYLTELLFSQLNISQTILDGTANDTTMLNYYSRTIEPIASAITDELKRKFLTKTARTQGQTIMSFRDPFKLVPVKELAELADKFTRNEIMSSNEIRQVIGIKPSDDPKADQLVNSNLNQSNLNMQETYGDQNLEDSELNNMEKPEESDKTNDQDESIEDIYNTLSDKQKDAVDELINLILADYGIQPEDE